jgi:glycosyltransferase involved in cell wall biosynthesis
MKIVFVNTLYAPNELGGAERSMRALAEAATGLGHEAVSISLAPDGVARRGQVGPVKAYYVPLANVYWPFRKQRVGPLRRALWHLLDSYNPVMRARVGAILDAERPDLVQTDNLLGFSVAAWRAARSRGIPVVQTLHDYYLACPNSSMFRGGRSCVSQCGGCRLLCTPRRALSTIPAAVVSVSRRTLERIEQSGSFGEVPHKMIAHGFNDVRADDPPARTNRPPGGVLRVGYLGRIEATKGIEVLLDAAQRMGPGSVRVLVAGKGEDAYVQALTARCPGIEVVFLGFTRPAELFAQIDLLVVPSVWEEPLGRVIFEAYEYGVPAAVSRVGGMPEIVDEGRTGFVFEAGNPSSLAALLTRQIEHGWAGARFFAACRAKSLEFSMERSFAKHAELWQTVRQMPVRA